MQQEVWALPRVLQSFWLNIHSEMANSLFEIVGPAYREKRQALCA